MSKEVRFYESLYKELDFCLSPEGYSIDRIEVYKNNFAHSGISIKKPDEHVSLVIYPEAYMGLDRPVSEIAAFIKDSLPKYSVPEDLSDKFDFSFDNIRDSIYTYVIGSENNEKFIKHLLCRPYLDLAVGVLIKLDNKHSVKMNETIMKAFSLDEDLLFDTAAENVRFECKLKPISDILGTSFSSFDVLTYGSGTYGASVICDTKLLKFVRKKEKENFYILPSSIHEVLILKESSVNTDVDTLKDLVKHINETEVNAEDKLTDSVYYFDGNELSIAE